MKLLIRISFKNKVEVLQLKKRQKSQVLALLNFPCYNPI